MNDKSSTELKAGLDQNLETKGDKKAPSDFVTGLVTFIIFLFFMTAWMYFSTE